jgi:hypothetical protein
MRSAKFKNPFAINDGDLMSRIFSASKITAIAILAVLAGMFAVAGPAAAVQSSGTAVRPAAGVVRVALDSKYWATDSDSHAGDCTMFRGAGWNLTSEGTMSFDGVVTSSEDGDAGLMRVRVLDYNGAELGWITNANPQTPDPAQFVQGMSDHNAQYHWIASGRFPANWYPLIGSIEIHNHC